MPVKNYCFTTEDRNDPRIAELKSKLKTTGYRVKLVGRTPKPGTKWQYGYLPLRDSQRFAVYIYPKDRYYRRALTRQIYSRPDISYEVVKSW